MGQIRQQKVAKQGQSQQNTLENPPQDGKGEVGGMSVTEDASTVQLLASKEEVVALAGRDNINQNDGTRPKIPTKSKISSQGS